MTGEERVDTVRTSRVAPLLFLSGMCALMYQVAWLRELRHVFGASTAATAAVLAVFMGGLGAGGVILRRRIDRARSPLLVYAQLELLVAATSTVTPLLVWIARKAYLALGGASTLGGAGATVVRILLAALVLAGPTLLMGGTLPAAARAVVRRADVGRRAIAILYGTNTVGAVAGAVLANFFLLEILGTRATLWFSALINLLVGLAARMVARTATAEADAEEAEEAAPAPSSPRFFPPVAAGVSGFAFLLMELVWYRMLSPLLGGSSYTFGLILAVALVGIGLGGLAYARVHDRPATLAAFGLTCALEAACIALPYALGDRLAALAIVLRPLGAFGLGGHVFAWSVVCAIVVLPAAIVSGYQFPLTIALFGPGRTDVARDVAFTYAANTLGSIAGSLAGGFGLMPLLTATGCWRLAAWTLIVAAALSTVLAVTKQGSRAPFAIGVATIAILMLVRSTGPTAAWRHSPIGAGRSDDAAVNASRNTLHDFLNKQRREISWQADGVESAVGVSTSNGYGFIINGKSDGSALFDTGTQVMSGLIGAALRPEVQRGLVVGLGTGSTAGWLGAVRGMSVDVIELEPAVRHVAELCAPVNRDVLSNPAVHVQIGDAREYLVTTKKAYDLVFSEPSNPYRAGVSSFFTADFYGSVFERLSARGIFLQWLQLYEVDGEVIRTTISTLRSVFPHVSIWETQADDALLVATKDPLVIDVDQLRTRLAEEPFAEAMRNAWFVDDVEGFVAHHVANEAFTRQVASLGTPPATDDRNPLEYAFARGVGRTALAPEAELWTLSRALRTDRPETKGDIDWTRVEVRRALLGVHALPRDAPPRLRSLYSAMTAFNHADVRSAGELWRAAGSPAPETLRERMLVAQIEAINGDPKAPEAIDALARERPGAAHIIRAHYLFETKQDEAAAKELELGLADYRDGPEWVEGEVAPAAFGLALKLAANPALRPRMLAATAQPLKVLAAETRRRTARARMAPPSDPACVEGWAGLEPNVDWDRGTLTTRYECYYLQHSPLADRAAEDLTDFLLQAPSQIGLGKLEETAGLRPSGE
jgi:spermidine synthase